MSRWAVALVGIGFAVAPVHAQPRPLWEIETSPDAKGYHAVRWLGFSPDGKTLVAQAVEKSDPDTLGDICRLLAWDVATRKEALNHKLGSCVRTDGSMAANAMTKVGSVLVAGESSVEVRLVDGANAAAKELPRPMGVWFNPENSDSLWLHSVDPFACDYRLAYGKMPPLAVDPKKATDREQWLKTKLPGEWRDGSLPIVAVNSDLTRLALYSRNDRKLSLYNVAVDDKLKLTEVAVIDRPHKGHLSALRFSPDGKTLATASGEASVGLWDVEKAGKDWKPRAMSAAGTFTVAALAFSPDGRTLAAGTWDEKVRPNLYLIDVNAGQLLASYQLPRSLHSVAYSPDGKVLVTGDTTGRIRAWDAGALRNP